MTAGIYEFGPRQGNKAYGGRSVEIEKRWAHHRWGLRNNKHHCRHLQNAWNLYGEDVFEFRILEVIEDPVERLAAEQLWLDEHWPNCYNTARYAIASGLGRTYTDEWKQAHSERMMGNQYGKGYKHTDAAKRKLSRLNTGELHPMWGKHPTAATRLKQGAARIGNQNAKGTKRTDEWRREKSEAMMGHPVSDATRQKLREAATGNQNMLGYRHTDATRRKMSASLMGNQRWLGRKHTEGTKDKIGAALAKPYPAFIHRDTGEIIPSGTNLTRMCREMGLHQGSMRRIKNDEQFCHRGWVLLVEEKTDSADSVC